ncbi:MAG: DNA-processing protein DprA, partial [candidate division Zixibacteria bacterium]|nr:DNA-processing protein DprA [candidate division Zixibacteria bacterium]
DALLRHFGRIEAIFEADRTSLAAIEGLAPAVIQSILSSHNRLEESQTYVESLRERDILITSRFDAGYPHQLFELNDPPVMLFCRGHLPIADKKTIAFMGADAATAEGIEMTSRLARLFAKAEVQVVSALSGGISAAAHLAAKSVGFPSFAVVDAGFDSIVGTVEMALAIDIASTGGLVAEYVPDAPPAKDALAQSNRLMVGLANAVIFTELYADSARAQDMLEFCNQNGKLTFFFVDPALGALADERSLQRAVENGAILITGYDMIPDIIRSLV